MYVESGTNELNSIFFFDPWDFAVKYSNKEIVFCFIQPLQGYVQQLLHRFFFPLSLFFSLLISQALLMGTGASLKFKEWNKEPCISPSAVLQSF